MRKKHSLEHLGAKVCSVGLSAALAVCMVPAVALAHYDYDNTTGKIVQTGATADTFAGTGGGVVKTASDTAAKTVTYMGLAHGDGQHYGSYSIYTTLTYNDKQELTALNLTSNQDTFFGPWGVDYPSKGSLYIEGYLPDGVDFDGTSRATVDSDGNTVYKPTLTGASDLGGYKITDVTWMTVTASEQTASGSLVSEVPDEYGYWNGKTDNNAEIAVYSDAVNMLCLTYRIGYENLYFHTYICIDDAADSFVDTIAPTTWTDPAEASDSASNNNRQYWTAVAATFVAEQLASWNSTLHMSDEELGGTKEIAELDTVSGATCSSNPIIWALNAAFLDGVFTGIADDIKVTINGGTESELDISGTDSRDPSYAETDEDGKSVVYAGYANLQAKARSSEGAGSTTIKNGAKVQAIQLYSIDEEGGQVIVDLGNQSDAYTPVYTYVTSNPDSAKCIEGLVADTTDYLLNPTTAADGTAFSADSDTYVGVYQTVIDDKYITYEFEPTYQPIKITINDDSINYVSVRYLFGTLQADVPYIDVVYNVADLKAATDVNEMIAALGDSPSAEDVLAARSAYMSLAYSVRSYVTNIDALIEAESALETSWKRLAGDNRFDTMKDIALTAFDTSEYAVIATGDNFPDALASSSLAGALNAPIVLIGAGNTQQAVDVLNALGTSKVYVIGGTSAVPESWLDEVTAAANVSVVARLQGNTRQGTAVAIANEVAKLGAASSTAVIATGKNFPDALSISSYSYAKGAPIYLTLDDGTLDTETLSAVKAAGYEDYLYVGGDAVVSGEVTGQIGANDTAVERLSGLVRYDTSLSIAEYCLNQDMLANGLVVATGEAFPDALAGAALAGSADSLIVLATEGQSSQAESLLSANKAGIVGAYALGGTSAISEALLNALEAATE